MALATPPPASGLLMYEQYLNEGEINRRYDILDGVRRYLSNPTREHQRLALRVARLLDDYARASGRAQAIIAPCDVLITRGTRRNCVETRTNC